MDSYDVVVVGGGPAGAMAALAARRTGASVLMLDRAVFPRDKACGDGLGPHTMTALTEYGITDVATGYPPVTRLHVVSPAGHTIVRDLPGYAHTIPRTVFDHRLVCAAIGSGVEFGQHHVRALQHGPDNILIDGRFAAKVVIGADGAASVVRRHCGLRARARSHTALAIRGYAPTHDSNHGWRVAYSPSGPLGYAWSFAIGGGIANVGYGQWPGDAPTSRAHLLQQLDRLIPEINLGEVALLRAHHLPMVEVRPVVGRDRLLIAGDAMSLINPMTGEGIYCAIRSGYIAGQAAAESIAITGGSDAAKRYSRAFRHRLGRHLSHVSLMALATSIALVDRAVRIGNKDQHVYETLTGLGLGEGTIDLRTLLSLANPFA